MRSEGNDRELEVKGQDGYEAAANNLNKCITNLASARVNHSYLLKVTPMQWRSWGEDGDEAIYRAAKHMRQAEVYVHEALERVLQALQSQIEGQVEEVAYKGE